MRQPGGPARPLQPLQKEGAARPRSAIPSVADYFRAFYGPPPRQDAALGGGPLPAALRGEVESRFGADFDDVRVHRDGRAEALGAQAYAQGSDIHLAPGRGDPATPEGLALLGHELAHVVQQRQGRVAGAQGQGGTIARDEALEREADAAGQALVRGEAIVLSGRGPEAAGAQRLAEGKPIQCFGSLEHQSLGNEGAESASYNLGGEKAEERFELTHGDIVALSGDYFLSEDLFRLAGIAGSNGTRVGSRDEVIYALYLVNPKDARFQTGGMWAQHAKRFQLNPPPKDVSDVIEAVKARYQQLAATNTVHFVAPRGRDAQGRPLPSQPGEGSAITSYRVGHEQALWLAYQAGLQKGAVGRALAQEAAAQHYLTDSFSAGHVRTPIGDIRAYWREKYPLFWYNLLHKMALDTAVQLNAQHGNLTTGAATVQMIYEGIIQQVEQMAANLPAVMLGDLLAKIFHDWDNARGLDIVGGGRLYGDEHLEQPDARNVTRNRAAFAVRAGNWDVNEAYQIGQAGMQLDDAALFATVRRANGGLGDRYLAESLVPRPVAELPQQNWRAGSFEELWNRPVVGSSGPPIGQLITEALGPGGEMRQTLDDLAAKFPPVDTHRSGDVEPRQAYLTGFVAPLVANPREGILGIIHWAPDYGLRGVDRDDIALGTAQELDRRGKLGGMTTEARVRYIRQLIDGSVDDEEGALVVRIFATAPASERRAIYRRIEGHDWSEDFRNGVISADDDLWNALSRPQLEQLKGLLNS